MTFRRYQSYPKNAPTGRVSKVPKTFPLIDVIAAACMVFHAAGDKIEKFDTSAVPAGVDYDGKPTAAIPAVISNKTAVLKILENPNTISQAAKDEAVLAIQAVQSQVTMSVLSGKNVSPFIRDMAATLDATDANGEIPSFRVGLLVYVPNVHHQAQEREERAEQIVDCLYTSQALGAAGDKVTVDFTMVEQRFLPAHGCNAVFGKDDKGNLVSFLTKHDSLCKSGKIVGKIKAVGADKYHNNATVTSLHYVKAV